MLEVKGDRRQMQLLDFRHNKYWEPKEEVKDQKNRREVYHIIALGSVLNLLSAHDILLHAVVVMQ